MNSNESWIVVLVQATLSALEEKLTLSQSEVQQVKVSVKQYESLVDSYKAQVWSSFHNLLIDYDYEFQILLFAQKLGFIKVF